MPLPSTPASRFLVAHAGDWLNSLGEPQPDFPVQRILCLKVDHIGDMLVADLAFRVLRDAFPDASITLVCGKWNVALAERLGHSDLVIGVEVLPATALEQSDPAIAEQRKRRGIEQIEALDLGPFDLAIDLRIEADTRDLLKLFDARIYAGVGDLAQFPFLDVALPPLETNLNEGPDSAILLPRDFVDGDGYVVGPYGLNFHSARTRLDLGFEITGAKSPADCGTAPRDTRLLGVGLIAITVTGLPAQNATDAPLAELLQARFTLGSRDAALLRQGWAIPEDWGTWTVEPQAMVSLPIVPDPHCERVQARITFRSHTNYGNPRIDVRITDREGDELLDQVCAGPDSLYTVDFTTTARLRSARACSRRVSIRAGNYLGSIRLFLERPEARRSLMVSVLGSNPRRVLTCISLPIADYATGQLNLGFAFSVANAQESITLEIGTLAEVSLRDVAILSVELHCIRPVPAKYPSAHMELQVAQLALSVAAQYSTRYEEMRQLSEEILSRPSAPGTPSAALRSRLEAMRSAGQILVGLGIGANKDTKRWPIPYVIELCSLLLSVKDVVILCFGGPREQADVQRLIGSVGNPDRMLNLCNATPLDTLGEVLTAVDLYVGYDTGTTHYAGKVGVRTFAIFAATHHPREWGPAGRNASWMMLHTPCSPCYLSNIAECHHGHVCMMNLLPSNVWGVLKPYVMAVQMMRRASAPAIAAE